MGAVDLVEGAVIGAEEILIGLPQPVRRRLRIVPETLLAVLQSRLNALLVRDVGVENDGADAFDDVFGDLDPVLPGLELEGGPGLRCRATRCATYSSSRSGSTGNMPARAALRTMSSNLVPRT